MCGEVWKIREVHEVENFAAEIPRFSNWVYSISAKAAQWNAGNSYRNLQPLRHCDWILHKRHVGAPGSARAHVPDITKARKGKGARWGKRPPFPRYVGRLRKRESDFHGKRMGFFGAERYFRSARSDPSFPFSMYWPRGFVRARFSFTWQHSERGLVRCWLVAKGWLNTYW